MAEEYSKKSVRPKKSKGKMVRPTEEEEEVDEPTETIEEDYMPMKKPSKKLEQKVAQPSSKLPPRPMAKKETPRERMKFYSEEMRPTYQQESVPNELEAAFEELQKLESDYQNESPSYSSMPQEDISGPPMRRRRETKVPMPPEGDRNSIEQQYQKNAMPQQFLRKGPTQQNQQQTKGGLYSALPPITVSQDISEIFQVNLRSSSITQFRVSRCTWLFERRTVNASLGLLRYQCKTDESHPMWCQFHVDRHSSFWDKSTWVASYMHD